MAKVPIKPENMLKVTASIALLAGTYLLRKWFAGGVCHCKGQLKGKTVLITGGNAGIGKETAKILAEKGGRIILACRDLKAANAIVEEIKRSTSNPNVFAMRLDLSSFNSIRAFVSKFLESEQRLDILINNAGCYYYPRALTEDGYEHTFQVNYLGHFLMTLLLLDRIKESSPSRIINVTSMAYNGYPEADLFSTILAEPSTYNFNLAYCKSKLAQVFFTSTLAEQLRESGVTVNCVHPGVVDTPIFKNVKLLSHPLWRTLLLPLIKLIFKTPFQGAQTTVHCAVSTECAVITGEYFKDCAPFPLEEVAENEDVAEHLWNESLRMTRLFPPQ